jgi:hypothetical protein
MGQYGGFILSGSHTQHTPNGSALSAHTGSEFLQHTEGDTRAKMIRDEHDAQTSCPHLARLRELGGTIATPVPVGN